MSPTQGDTLRAASIALRAASRRLRTQARSLRMMSQHARDVSEQVMDECVATRLAFGRGSQLARSLSTGYAQPLHSRT